MRVYACVFGVQWKNLSLLYCAFDDVRQLDILGWLNLTPVVVRKRLETRCHWYKIVCDRMLFIISISL